MDSTPNPDRDTERHDRALIYASAYRNEIGVEIPRQVQECKADAERHDALVAGVVTEEALRHRGCPPLRRPGLSQAIRQVRALGQRGVLLSLTPDRISGGSMLDLALACALVEDTGGAVVTVEPMFLDRTDHVRMFDTVRTLLTFAKQRDQLRRRDDMAALHRTATWPLGPGGPDDG